MGATLRCSAASHSVASLVREAWALGAGASVVAARVGSAVAVPRLQRTGSVVVVQGLGSSAACGILQTGDPYALTSVGRLLPNEPPALKRFIYLFLMSCYSTKG